VFYHNIRNGNEKVTTFFENNNEIFNEDATLNYEGAPAEYEDIADYIRRPIRGVRIA
jgi:hypothetical protein